MPTTTNLNSNDDPWKPQITVVFTGTWWGIYNEGEGKIAGCRDTVVNATMDLGLWAG